MIGRNGLSQARRVRVRALESSALTMALMLAGPAFAQCTPDPTVANGITTCTGTDADGIVVTTRGTNVVVEQDATVNGSNGPAIAVRLPFTDGYDPVSVSVSGLVDGGQSAGISHAIQSSFSSYYPQSLILNVAAGGRVTGANGLTVDQSGPSYYNYGYVNIDNSGDISGTSGIALILNAGNISVTNRAGGKIGAIAGSLNSLNNAGTIDGGDRSAIVGGVSGYTFTNSGTITSNSATATIANTSGLNNLTNSGTIENLGNGAALASMYGITIDNTGRIATAGATAIDSAYALRLTNAGTIVGDVVSNSNPYGDGSFVDSTVGRIAGSLRLGAGADTVVATYDGTRLQYGIDGAVDGGAGNDTVRVSFAADQTIAAPLVLPTTFERVALSINEGVTTTLDSGFTTTGTLFVSGRGTLLNRAALNSPEAIFASEGFSSLLPTIVNAGSITSTDNSGLYAISFYGFSSRFENSGSIGAVRNAVNLSGSIGFLNSGTITAGNNALSLSGAFNNSATGVIRSTGGTALRFGGSYNPDHINAGLIEGVIGVSMGSALLDNSGTIRGTTTGVLLDYDATINNLTDGVISGPVAITTQPPGTSFFNSNATVGNAGTINGNVLLGNGNQSYYGYGNRYFALPGGILNGNLTLGQGDLFVTELINTGPGTYAGVTGTVTGNNAQLRLRVRSDAAITLLAPTNGFANVGYEVMDNAALTLTGSTGSRPLILSGRGSVDLTSDIATATGPAIRSVPIAFIAGETRPDQDLTITSRGTISLTRTDANTFPGTAIALSEGSTFINEGTIVAADRSNPYYTYNRFSAISGGYDNYYGLAAQVTNNGTISLDGTVGITAVRTVVNNGTIGQVANGRAATGIRASSYGNQTTITNNGTIDVGGIAISGDYAAFSVTNNGRIASSGDIAIAADGGGYPLVLDNRAGGTIIGGPGQLAIRVGAGTVTNAGTITGSVDLGYNNSDRSYGSATYVADGGTIEGDLLFGRGSDKLIFFSTFGVSGRIDGGDGIDTLIYGRRSSDTVTLDPGLLSGIGFEAMGAWAYGSDTVVTVRGDAPLVGDFNLSGDGTIVSTLTIEGNAFVDSPYTIDSNGRYRNGAPLSGFTNQGTITGRFSGPVRSFTNSGTIGNATSGDSAVSIYTDETLAFANSGTLAGSSSYGPTALLEVGNGKTIVASNDGTIIGGLQASLNRVPPFGLPVPNDPLLSTDPLTISFSNSGTITASENVYNGGVTVGLSTRLANDAPATITFVNTGTIEALGITGTAASLNSYSSSTDAIATNVVTNAGMIRANAGGTDRFYYDYSTNTLLTYIDYAVALSVAPGRNGQVQVTNTAAGTIEATGEKSVALWAGGTLDLANAGTIRGGTGTVSVTDEPSVVYLGRPYIAGAIQTDAGNDRIVNTGTIIGSIDLAAGNDRIDNLGRIEGNVFLGEGDDTFLQRASATLIGTVDAGAGTDTFIVDATGGGTVNGDQFVNFERFSQIGSGNVGYAGNFRLNTIDLIGGTIGVTAGQTLTSDGPFTITGSDAVETVDNDGAVSGGVTLGAGNDRVVNRGTIGGTVLLGAGDDSFVDGPNGSVAGGVDGGAGTDSYSVVLAGNRSGINARTGFERLSLEGTGTLTLALDQSFEAVALTGTGLTATLGGFSLGTVTGSDAAEQLMVDGDVASVALRAGNDMLALGTQLAAGRYDGGMGTDTLAFTNTGPVTLTGTATGFEQVALTGGALNIAGTLGSTGSALSFGDGAQSVTVAAGGTLAGVVDLGAGNDSLTFAAQTVAGSYDGGAGTDTLAFTNTGPVTLTGTATGFEQVALTNGTLTVAGTLGTVNAPLSFGDGAQTLTVASGGTLAGVIDLGAGNDALRLAGTLTGTVAGGAGSDTATLVLTGDRSLASTTLTGFETLASEGTGTLTLTGTHGYDAVNAGTSLTLASGSTLTAPVRFGSGDQRFTIAGTFTGSVDGGAGSDTLAITGGTAAFGTVANVEALAMSGGLATVSGTATLGSVDMTGGRLVGLAGSVLNGSFAVRSGATFGSAGTVNGNVTVAGILSPGASPGTMTVNGNVALASGSLSLFEFTPTAQDKLVINGTLAIASGSTLQLTQSGTLRPGASYDLITASGGITGSFTTIQKPDSLFGFVVQRTDRIQLLGQFLTDASFSPQVGRSVAYANTVLQTQPATSALFAVLPALTTGTGASNLQAFARLTPEAYATATQAGVENALALSDIARGPGFAPNRSEPGGFTFGQAIGSWYRLAADADTGVSRARTSSYGFIGGIGYGDSSWSVGAFGGYLNSRQRIDTLAARSDIDGWVAGVHGRYEAGNFGFGASIAYNAGKADTNRALPASVASRASYDLNSIVSDLSAHYTIDMGEWALRPRAGVTYIRTARDRVVEAGGPFALTVAADKHVAGFADAGIGFARAETSDAAFRPFVSMGVRYQIEGQRADAVAGYAGGPLGLVAQGAGRAQAVGTISAGLVQRVTDGLDLFSTVSAQTGKDDHREAISTGVRLRF